MKIIAKCLSFLIVFLLSSHTLTAQPTLSVKEIQPLIALASDLNDGVAPAAEYNSSSLQYYMEDNLQVEDWMVQPFAPTRNPLSELLREVKEEPLQLCPWMICCADWKIVGL
ncbi:hypothetical protein ACFLTU_01845 [Bacteroidota bacterium]